MVIVLGGWALIAQNYKYLKMESLSFQIADEKKSDVPLILFLLSCSAAAPQCVNISFIHEKIHYFSPNKGFHRAEAEFSFSYHTFVDFHHHRGVGFPALSDLEAERGSPFFFVLSADLRARARWRACCCSCVLSGSLSFQAYVGQVD